MREATIERALIARVRAAGGIVRKVQWIGRRAAPDRLVLLPGRCLWVEVKRPGAKPDPRQQREFTRLREYGLIVVVVDSLEAVDAVVGRADVAGAADRRTGE